MAIGFSSAYNYAEFLKMTKKIDEIFAKRVEVTAQLFVNEGRLMLNEFRLVQQSVPPMPYPKGSKALKRTVRSEEEKKVDMGKAIAYAQTHAGDAPWLKRGDPWINRTSRAAKGVFSYVEKTPESLAVGLYHTMSYGAYLEFAHNRKYAAIEPIVRSHNPLLLEKVNLLFREN
jgi:hypothetical protein